MNTTAAQLRKERIERLLSELEYELTRGIMEREIEPDLHFSKRLPCIGRGDGTAVIELHVSPGSKFHSAVGRPASVKLRVVEGGRG